MPIYAVVIAQMPSINTPTTRRLLLWPLPAFWSSADLETWMLDCHWLIARDPCVLRRLLRKLKNKSISLKWYANRYCEYLRKYARRPTQEYKSHYASAYLRKLVYAKGSAYYGVPSINPALRGRRDRHEVRMPLDLWEIEWHTCARHGTRGKRTLRGRSFSS